MLQFPSIPAKEIVVALVVKYAVYGALSNGSQDLALACDVTASLQTLINQNAGVVTISNSSFGDPDIYNAKHFGAVVNRNGQDFFFACQEGQKIDFNHAGGQSPSTSLRVIYAVYGALANGNLSQSEAFDVSASLQSLLTTNNGLVIHNGIVTISNASFGGDPCPGSVKQFMAVVRRNGIDYCFACQENQVINFTTGGSAGH
jgi:hypothetical protein